jgi:hypothetical protein
MLANRETEDITRVRKSEAISTVLVNMTEATTANHEHGSVWGNNNLFFESELLPFLWIKNGLPN